MKNEDTQQSRKEQIRNIKNDLAGKVFQFQRLLLK